MGPPDSGNGPHRRGDRLQITLAASHDSAGAGRVGSLTRTQWLALSDERALARRLQHGFWAEGYQLGRERGRREGYEASEADMAAQWREIASPVARGGLSYAELERRRYGPGGRAHFGDPRPGDYPGTGGPGRA